MTRIDDIASGAWTRLRNLIGALDRVDRLETSSGLAIGSRIDTGGVQFGSPFKPFGEKT